MQKIILNIFKRKRGFWLSLIASFSSLSATYAQQVNDTSFNSEDYIGATDEISITLDSLPDIGADRLAFFLDNTDLTAFFVNDGETFTYPAGSPPLPPGQNEIIVFLIQDTEDWQEIARLPVSVLTDSGFEEAELNPTVDLAITAQLDANAKGDAPEFERRTFQDLEMQLGLESHHRRSDLLIDATVNASAFSFREEALRYGELEDDAPRLDLNEYLVSAERGPMKFSLGHISYGNHPLLLDSVSNRGLSFRYQITDRLDASFSSMNGTSIVGYNNIFGLSDIQEHNISAASLGFEFLPERPGGLRAEITYMDGSIRSEDDFNVGEISDTEESRGFGLRLLGTTESGRLRGELNYARSRFTNPDDPSLDPDGEVVEVIPSTDNAYSAEVAYDVLQDVEMFGDQFMSLTATARHDYGDALYRSLGAFSEANLRKTIVGLDANLGDLSAQLSYIHAQDNVDDIPTLLTTRTKSWNFALSLPKFYWASGEGETQWWLPDVTYTFEHVRQQAVNDPDPEQSGFNGGSHLPDQVTRIDGIDVNWYGDFWSFGYRFSYSNQDNRQVGRENDDFKNLENGINFSFQAQEGLNLNFGFSRIRNNDIAQGVVAYSKSVNVGIDWAFHPNWTFSSNVAFTDDNDNQNNSFRDSISAQTQLSWRFELPTPNGGTLPGEWFLRYTYEDQNDQDLLFDFESNATTWTVNSGLSFSLF